MQYLKIHPADNVEVNLDNGHKYAVRDIQKGEEIIKYGNTIGRATADILKGEHVHSHNLATNLGGKTEYTFSPSRTPVAARKCEQNFMGYIRPDGQVGIRNEIWIINTVGCVNKTARKLAELTGAKCFEHTYGCSQLGEDQAVTQLILKGLVNHPNAGGVLVLGLGCENNNIAEFKKVLGEWDENRVKFLNAQDYEDEIAKGVEIIEELKEYASSFKPQPVPLNRLKVGLKCGGSDGYSGISANALVGTFTDRHTALGGTCILTEVPEMFGAEHLLMERCLNEEIFNKAVDLINNFKDYFTRHNQVVYENPSPGNKEGGITTLEEKSLGCVQKGGNATVVDVLDYGDTATLGGLNLLNGPGNDMVAVTNLTAAGAHLILFTTGRGTPLGGPVPTIKISSNGNLTERKQNWIDFDASPLLSGEDMADLCDRLSHKIIKVASGEQAKNEQNGYSEISIFKDGIVL